MADWMAFNVADYTTNTLHLTTRQHGAYILLICAAWSGKGALPGSDAALMAIAKLSPKEWAADGEVVKAFLTRRDDCWVHERVEFEWLDSQALIKAKSAAGKEGARRRWAGRSNGKSMAVPSASHGQTDAPEPLPNPLPPSHGNTSTVAVRASASPDGPPRTQLPESAKWAERLAGYRPWEGVRTWHPTWGPTPDSAGVNPLIPPKMREDWRAMCAEKMAELRLKEKAA